jgi:signal peptidase I
MLLALSLIVAAGMVGWVATDAARRQRNWLAWALLVALTGVVGMIVWLFARRSTPVVRPRLGVGLAAALYLSGIPLVFLNIAATMFIVTFLFQVAWVQGRAMEPTLADGDRVIVSKWAYHTGAPRVGDIVMLYYPLNPDKTFVKRVIAEEGDQIRIIEGRVYRNEVPLDDNYVPAAFRSHEDWGPEVIPEGYYFVMGDHRNNSSDSRHWGMVPKKYILGKVRLRWWPLGALRLF